MANKFYQKHKQRFQKEAQKNYQNLFEEEKTKGEKMCEKDIKIFQ